MGQIYKQAAKTIVWLGRESQDVAGAIDFLHVLAKKSRWMKMDERLGKRELKDFKFRTEWRAVKCLLEKPWWTRVWTLQEFIIPPNLKFYCGEKGIDRSKMNSAVYGIWLCRGADDIPLSKASFGAA
jgi:hypothetical protein